jgi:hypothetical protein
MERPYTVGLNNVCLIPYIELFYRGQTPSSVWLYSDGVRVPSLRVVDANTGAHSRFLSSPTCSQDTHLDQQQAAIVSTAGTPDRAMQELLSGELACGPSVPPSLSTEN